MTNMEKRETTSLRSHRETTKNDERKRREEKEKPFAERKRTTKTVFACSSSGKGCYVNSPGNKAEKQKISVIYKKNNILHKTTGLRYVNILNPN